MKREIFWDNVLHALMVVAVVLEAVAIVRVVMDCVSQ